MTLVAVLVMLFSVVFPALKMLALSASLLRPSLLHRGHRPYVSHPAFDHPVERHKRHENRQRHHVGHRPLG